MMWQAQNGHAINPLTLFVSCLKNWHLKMKYSQEPMWIAAEQAARIMNNTCCVGTCLQIEGRQIGWKRQEVSSMKLRKHVV